MMRMVLLNGLEKDEQSSFINDILLLFENNNIEITHFKLKDMNILPCTACGSCGLITPGQCVIKDDMEQIIKTISDSQGMVFVTPIRFGGYASTLKKVIDRFMLLGLPLYIYKEGHLLHPMRYDLKWLIGIGIDEKRKKNQVKSFEKLIAHNGLNMLVEHKTHILHPHYFTSTDKFILNGMLKEVSGS